MNTVDALHEAFRRVGMADAGWEGKAKMLFCGRKRSKREVTNCQISDFKAEVRQQR